MERVAHISLHGDPLEPLGSIEAGGQNVYVKNVAMELARRGVKADVYTRWNTAEKRRVEEIVPGARSIRLKGGPRAFLKKERLLEHLPEMLADFQQFTAEHGLRYDLIHTHYYVEGAFGLELSSRLGVPQAHTFHSLGRVKYNHERLQGNPDPADYTERFAIERRLMNRCDLLIATSPNEADDFSDWYQHSNLNTVVIPCGVDPRLFLSVERGGARAALGLPENRTILLYVGRLDQRKGLETLLFAYRKLLFDLGSRSDEVLLVIVGGKLDSSDQETRHFRQLAASLQLDEFDPKHPRGGHVLFSGSHPQPIVAQYYSAADMTIIPSCYEPFGMVAIETQACGTPAIASAVGGLKYAVEDGNGGLLVKPYSPSDLCEKIFRLVTDPSLRADLGERGRRRVLQHFTWSAIGDALAQSYEEQLLVRRRRALAGVAAAGVPLMPEADPALPFFTRNMMVGTSAPSPAPGTPTAVAFQ